MAWYAFRDDPQAPEEAARFRMQQGQEVGELARKLYPDGVLVPLFHGERAAQITNQYIAHGHNTIFEATVATAPFVARADILNRVGNGWHVLEVKSSFSDTPGLSSQIDDLAYTVMVLRRSGLRVSQASLVLLSRQYRFGDNPERLFDVVDVTADALSRADEFAAIADSTATVIFHDEPPGPQLSCGCRVCTAAGDACHRATGVPTVLEIPSLHFKKLQRLSAEGIVAMSEIPDDLELNDRQNRAVKSAVSGQMIVEASLESALTEFIWPCHYLDFETVATVLPLYQGHGCHEQVLTQFSIHHRERIDSEVRHSEYLAEAARDCQRELAVTLIRALGQNGSVVVYSGFERTRIRGLQKLFPDLSEQLQGILDRLVDLLPILADHVYHPEFRGSFSIKKVLPALLPELSYTGLAIQDGEMAITRFARMARGEIVGDEAKATRLQLLDYCEMDTLAMVRLHEKLVELARSTDELVKRAND
jgi:hypothetical protein